MRAFFRRLRARIKYWHHERDLKRELELHQEMAARDIRGDADSERDARARARRLLGNDTIAREDARAVWVARWIEQGWQDVRYAFRGFRRDVRFTLGAVVMLAFGLGLTTGGFTFVNGLLFRGFPVPDNDKVFLVQPVFKESVGRVDDGLSYGAYQHVSANATLADYVATAGVFVNVGATSDQRFAGRVPTGLYVSDNFFQALHIRLQIGTAPAPAAPGAQPMVVISDQAWRTIFSSDPHVIGRTAWLNGHPATIAGVTSPDFTGLGRNTLVYAPLSAAVTLDAQPSLRNAMTKPDACCVRVIARERVGASRAAIRAELDGLVAQYRSSIGQGPLTLNLMDTAAGATLGSRGSAVALLAMFGAATLLLLVLTCANVGNLYLARSLRRHHEITTRLALGAGRGRLTRQLLTEGLALSSLAGGVAFALAAAVPKLMAATGADFSAGSFSPDWRVALVTGIAVCVVCAIVSLAPALRATRVVWRGAAPMATARTGGLRSALLAVQIAIATVLIMSAALIARGIQFGVSGPADFALTTTTAATLEWPSNAQPTDAALKLFRTNLSAAAAQSQSMIGLANQIPVSDRAGIKTVVRRPSANVDYEAQLFPIDASAGRVLGLRMVAGRWAADSDSSLEAVINETMARNAFAGGPAIGQPLRLGFNDKIYVVVGVTADAHILSPGNIDPIIHIPPIDWSPILLTSKTAAAEAEVRGLVASLAPSATLTFTPLTESIRRSVDDALMGAAMAGGLGGVALLLAMIGVYSVFSFLVEERRREIGIRVALGASRVQIRTAVFRATRGGIVGGLTAGALLSIIAGFVLRRFLFGMSPADPISYLAVGTVLIATALAATAIPLRRALRANPSGLLRAD